MSDLRRLPGSKRKEGTPDTGDQAGRQRGRFNARLLRASVEWERSNGGRQLDDDVARDVLRRLEVLPLSAMMETQELSLWRCSLIRRGLHAPHARHRKLPWGCMRQAQTAPQKEHLTQNVKAVSSLTRHTLI